MYEHILISTDGSEVAQKGVDHGLSLAKSIGARITIVVDFIVPAHRIVPSPQPSLPRAHCRLRAYGTMRTTTSTMPFDFNSVVSRR